MAKRAIILDSIADGAGRQTEVRVAFWADVPAPRQRFYANPEATSAFLDADATELAAIRTGAIAERVEIVRRDPGSTNAQLRAEIQRAWQAWQDEITAQNPWARYGSSFNTDGTWTGVAVG